MSASIAIAKETLSGNIVHINFVNKNDKNNYVCCECNKILIPIKSKPRLKDWHFRHPGFYNINKCRNRALHDFAVQIIKINTSIKLPILETISYTYKQSEAWITEDYRSDATVLHEDEDLHVEVFVSNDVKPIKKETYITEKIRCIRIDLSDRKMKTVSPEIIEQKVLQELANKSWIYFSELINLPPKIEHLSPPELSQSNAIFEKIEKKSILNQLLDNPILMIIVGALVYLFLKSSKKSKWKERYTSYRKGKKPRVDKRKYFNRNSY